MKRFVLGCLSLIVLFAFSLPFELPRSLVLGWILFLYHTLPRITVDWPSVFVGGIALGLFIGGVHAAGRSWLRHRDTKRPRWKLRWSLAVVAVVVLLFAAGISLVGIVHQAAWLAASREPLYVPALRWNGYRSSRNNLKQIGFAVMNYTDAYGGRFPAGGTFTPDGRMLHSWETYILPFMLYSTVDIDFTIPWDDPRNAKYFQCILMDFVNGDLPTPALFDERGFGLSHYAANSCVLAANKGLRLADLTDGAANTLLIGEINANFKPWGHAVNWRDPAKGINRSPNGFGGPPSTGGAFFSMADGSVRFVSERIATDVLRALSTPAGSEATDASVLGPKR